MSNPIIADNIPVKVNFSKNKEYHFCTLRQKLNIEKSSKQLHNFFDASVELMQVMARACGPPCG